MVECQIHVASPFRPDPFVCGYSGLALPGDCSQITCGRFSSGVGVVRAS